MGQLAKASRQVTIAPARNEEVRFVDDAGVEIVLTSNDIRTRICENASDREMAFFMELCRSQRLNPFKNEAYLVKYGDRPAQNITAHKVLLRRADNHPAYDGMEYGITVCVHDQNGVPTVMNVQREACYPALGEQMVGGWCKVYRKDRSRPFVNELSIAEMGSGQSTWKRMPGVMIVKCAQAAALRAAFPKDSMIPVRMVATLGSACTWRRSHP